MIEVKNLSKEFQVHKKDPGLLGSMRSLVKRNYITKNALDNFSLDIPNGEIIGLIGGNGAGKTTLTKILSGIIHPSKGVVKVNGYVPWDRNNEYRRSMSVIMGQKAQLWWDLPAMDGFLLLKEIYQIPTNDFYQTVEYLSEYLGIKDQLNVQVRRLSLGERMKVEIMAALIHKPSVIFLDEPTIGLDITAQKAVRSFLKQYHQEHRPTMILTSHYMDDIEELCPRIVILRKGQKIFDDRIEKIHRDYSPRKMITAHLAPGFEAENILKKFPKEIGKIALEDNIITITSPKEQVMLAAKYLLEHSQVSDLNIQGEDIADLIENIMLQEN